MENATILPLKKLLIKTSHVSSSEEKIRKQGEKFALNLFHEAAVRVPAYKKFLKAHEINHTKIKTIADFKYVPAVDKKNYIDVYSFPELVWDGDVSKAGVINTSSGTTGNAYFWPVSEKEFVEGANIHRDIFVDQFGVEKSRTLLLVCFGMGTWVAGMYTFMCSYYAGKSRLPLTIMTPGFNKKEIIRIMSELAEKFDQTIIAGYPTFIKDIMEEWKEHPKASKITTKFLFAGEAFSESWRDYVLALIKQESHPEHMINILGSADAIIMGYETPQSIALRRLADSNKLLAMQLFGQERVPSLESYIPTHRFFEIENNELILTANRSIPLIRYNIHDIGGLLSYSQAREICKNEGVILDEEVKKYSHKKVHKELPFVYVFGRGKFTATLFAANIYPENVKEVLIDKHVGEFVTGKFTLETKYTKTHDHYLQLNVELAEWIKPSKELEKLIAKTFVHKVQHLNSEYKKIHSEYGSKVAPIVVLYVYGDANLFPQGRVKKTS